MSTVVTVTNQTVQKWKVLPNPSIDLTAEVSDLVTECVMQCVFGASSEALGKLSHTAQGVTSMLYPGQYLKHNFVDHMKR